MTESDNLKIYRHYTSIYSDLLLIYCLYRCSYERIDAFVRSLSYAYHLITSFQLMRYLQKRLPDVKMPVS